MLVGLAYLAINRWVQAAAGMHLIAYVATRAVCHNAGYLSLELSGQLHAAEVSPVGREPPCQTIGRNPKVARIANYRWKIIVAPKAGRQCLNVDGVHKGHAFADRKS